MNQLYLPNYNLQWTLLGGQSFGWEQEGEYFYGFTQKRAIKLKRQGDFILWQTYPERDDEEFIKEYLRYDVDYEHIIQKISKDEHINLAIEKYPHLRLLKQDFEETSLSFILSANNSIKNIRRSIRLINQKFGKPITADDKKIFLFPESEIIAQAKLEDLLETGIGFRAKYFKSAAEHLLSSNLSKNIKDLNDTEARAELKRINGVGDKIADCVLIFSLSMDHVTPLDVWGKRVLTDLYQLDPKLKYEDMRKWVSEYFEGYAGWAGQFLFEYIRKRNSSYPLISSSRTSTFSTFASLGPL